MKETILAKLFSIGILLMFIGSLYSIFDGDVTIAAIISFIGFVMMMFGAYKNGFKF